MLQHHYGLQKELIPGGGGKGILINIDYFFSSWDVQVIFWGEILFFSIWNSIWALTSSFKWKFDKIVIDKWKKNLIFFERNTVEHLRITQEIVFSPGISGLFLKGISGILIFICFM